MGNESGLRLANLFYAFYYTNWLEMREYYQSKNKITKENECNTKKLAQKN